MAKQNSYQKMKSKYENKIQELYNDIYSLVKNDEKYFMVKKKWDLKINIENAIMAGVIYYDDTIK